MTLANKFTILRLLMALAMFALLTGNDREFHAVALTLFIIAASTDWVDGYIARKTHTTSAFGKVADPIADKFLVLGALVALLRTRELGIPFWGVFLVIAREILIGGVRVLTSSQGKIPAADRWGKFKMVIQCIAVGLMLVILVLKEYGVAPKWALALPYPLTMICVLVAWQSALHYLYRSKDVLRKSWR